MLQAIETYNARGLNEKIDHLRQLIDKLDSLRRSLTVQSPLFVEQFEPEWATLEEVYAFLMDRGASHLDDIGKDLIEKALAEIALLIKKVTENRS